MFELHKKKNSRRILFSKLSVILMEIEPFLKINKKRVFKNSILQCEIKIFKFWKKKKVSVSKKKTGYEVPTFLDFISVIINATFLWNKIRSNDMILTKLHMIDCCRYVSEHKIHIFFCLLIDGEKLILILCFLHNCIDIFS